MEKFWIQNTLKNKKEEFKPLNPPFVGLYVCGPTVYGDAHLGHARPAITFDLLYRYFMHIGYKVRYVRNITDVGHLENDADEGEDKIGKKARLEQLEPMEVVQLYTNHYHKNMEQLNTLRPNIEPSASGHIIEQIEMIKKIIENGYAYESKGNVYFDVEKYNEKFNYGILSGRKLEDMISNTRDLQGQDEKKNPFDFALWKKAEPKHIMRWPSPWSEGFPGWHVECSAMGVKYLGEEFDIHGGGMDLLFPHHECEIAQSKAALKKDTVKYWMHNNMITINGQKMGKSLGNFITLDELFSGKHELLEKEYSPMTIRFFLLQAHYRSTLDFSNRALQASEKGLERLLNAYQKIEKLKPEKQGTVDANDLKNKCYAAMYDDLNSPMAIAHLFDGLKIISAIEQEKEKIDAKNLEILKNTYKNFIFDIFGLKYESNETEQNDKTLNDVVELLLNVRMKAKENKDFESADFIRNELTKLGITVKDKKDGFEWEM